MYCNTCDLLIIAVDLAYKSSHNSWPVTLIIFILGDKFNEVGLSNELKL